jgi:hypothetical protein
VPGYPASDYQERLWPPWWLWVVGWLIVLSLGLAFLVAVGPMGGALATVIPGALLTWGLVSAASSVRVVDGELLAGLAHIPLDLLGAVRPLGPDEARAVRGPQADPAAYYLLRGWVPTAVRAEVIDPADPVPYWYVSTRHPEVLAAAIEAGRTSS